jgi:TRAP-type C4-dicarboxylate transport system permease small subunit
VKSLLLKVDQGIEKGTSLVLVISVFLILFLSVGTILLRFFNQSISWFEPLIRHLVLLATFLGGALATGRGNHIAIDILGKYMETKNLHQAKRWVDRFIYLVCFITLAWLTLACYQFMKVELKYGRDVFLGIHSGVLVGILPLGLILITLRYLLKFYLSFTDKEVKS